MVIPALVVLIALARTEDFAILLRVTLALTTRSDRTFDVKQHEIDSLLMKWVHDEKIFLKELKLSLKSPKAPKKRRMPPHNFPRKRACRKSLAHVLNKCALYVSLLAIDRLVVFRDLALARHPRLARLDNNHNYIIEHHISIFHSVFSQVVW